jgi:uncharacterized protein YkwD
MTDLRRVLRVVAVPLLLTLAIVSTSQPAVAGARSQRFRTDMLQLVNQTRRVHGLSTFLLNRRLSTEAWRHSLSMGRRFLLYHTSNLAALVQPYGAHAWGENIAYARTLQRVEQLWMQSYEHRVNLLNPAFHRAAIGIVKIRGWLWVTLQLYG